MSEKSGKGLGRFIPTLTEVIEQPDLLNQLEQEDASQLQKEPDVEPPMDRTSETPESSKAVKSTSEKIPLAFLQRWSLPTKVFAEANVPAQQAQPEPIVEKPVPQTVTSGSVFVGQPFQTKPTASSSGAPQQTALDDVSLPQDEDLLRDNQEMFSALSRSPAAEPDSLRPSDLMLVALSERIAGKARIRMEKNIEAHIQELIFPLLDRFSAQLVGHIQDDLVKIMRESVAEATREELDWLRQKGNKARS